MEAIFGQNSGTDIGHPAGIGLPVGRYRLRYARREQSRMPAYAGSAWRGDFGHALKHTVCITRLHRCPDCLLYRSCVYPYIFETPPPPLARKMRRYDAAPHPFIMETPLVDEPAADSPFIELGLNLFGDANRHLPYVIYAFQRAGAEGLGKGRIPLRLVAVLQSPDLGDHWLAIHEPGGALEPQPAVTPKVPMFPGTGPAGGPARVRATSGAPTGPTELRVELLTPLRIRRDNSLIDAANFSFAHFFNVLLRRISMLTYFHTDTPLETDFKALVGQSREIPLLSSRLRWHDWTRYSSRQETTMEMGGLVGTFTVPMQGLEPFWPYLWVGQWTHAGKGASMGLGRYRIAPASLPDVSR